MNMLWRILWMFFTVRQEKDFSILSPSNIELHALPTDIDFLFHINNGRYFSLMDLGRINMLIKSGLMKKLKQNNFYPVVATEITRFKKSIRLFEKFKLTTHVVYWDDKYFYIKHEFLKGDELCARGLVKSCFLRKGGGIVTTQEIFSIAGITPATPILPAYIEPMNEWDNQGSSATF